MTTAQETTLHISGMSCQHCVQTITKTLTAFPEAQHVQVDLATKTARLTHNPDALPRARVETALAEAGYPVDSPMAKRGKSLPLL